MYGLLLENFAEYVKSVYGEDKWEEIRRKASVEQPSFSVHQVYSESLIPKLARSAMEVLNVSEKEFFDRLGVHFVGFVSQYGYDRVLSVLGRHMRDFLNGLDNLHEYLKFSYPRMRAPSFICENETREGLTLHYRSKRRGFVYYAMGQIREVARHFYNKEMEIELVREEILFDTVHVTFQLRFDNRAFTLACMSMTREEKHLPISANVLFEIFPFCIVFSSDMVIRSIGNSLMVILPDLVGKKVNNWFDLVRPLIAFKFQNILNRTNNIFELVTVEPVLTKRPSDRSLDAIIMSDESDGGPDDRKLRLKGQMIYMDNWRMMMYLGTPVMPDLNSLIITGLYINDLSMHDFSRDLMLAGTQQSVELKLALDQEQHKSKKLEESMRKLDEEMKRTDELLYQMIPKQVADRLRAGENPIDTCQMFDTVSILFSDVVTFTEICSRITPMEVVSMLNAMYSIFDQLTERNKVYKVETIGDAYMVVSGAPERETDHAKKVCDMALDMVDAITDLKDPSTGLHLKIRVGIHSGAVVAGIVGLKMPRYCLFGDSVNTASRMESTSESMKIHISQSTKDLISSDYHVEERGEVQVKGKGKMKTYWLIKHEHRPRVRGLLPNDEFLENNIEPDHPLPLSTSYSADKVHGDEKDKRIYSPITFHDVRARFSISEVPVNNNLNKTKENRSSSLGAVALGQSMLQGGRFGLNKTAPTSPIDSYLSPIHNKTNVFLNEVMTYQSSPQKEEPKNSPQKEQPTIAAAPKEIPVEATNSISTPQRIRQLKEVSNSDNSLNQNNAEVNIIAGEDKSTPLFAMSNTQKFNHVKMLGPNGIFVEKFCRTKTEVHKVDFLWIIDNYSFHHAKKSILESARFTADTNHDCRWYLKLYCDADYKSEDVMGLSLHLDFSSSGKNMFMKYKFSILDDKLKENHTVTSSDVREVIPGGHGWGRPRFILKDYLSRPTLFPGDKLSIYCQIVFSEVNGLLEISEESNTNSIQLEADRPGCNISKDLGDLFEKRKLTDVTLSVNGQNYAAHKIILAARSPVFAAMFEHNMKENDNNLVEITDIEEAVVEEMLHYIYTDRCENMKDIATGLLAAADKYDLEGLKSKCQEALINGLTVENACETLKLAHLHCAAELQSKTVDFIAANSVEIMKSDGWKKFAPLYPQSLLMEMFEASSRRAGASFN